MASGKLNESEAVAEKISATDTFTNSPAARYSSSAILKKVQNIGLSTWAKVPDGKILKSNVSEAKTYLREKEVLPDAGKVTAEFAKQFAESEFEKYRVIQDRLFSSDFDKFEDDGLGLLPE